MMKRIAYLFLGLLVLALAAVLSWQYFSDPGADQISEVVSNRAEQIKRGAYLARAGDCMGCHTARGGAEYAGGRLIATPFGEFYSPNITADPVTGLGRWSADDFWRALHNGKSKDGAFLYPAFPYPSYTKITRADADAMYAYFQTVPAVAQQNRPHALRFPYNQRPLLAIWRALYFRPGVYQPDTGQSVSWNRGAYLVQGLGHCSACHADRNALGATSNNLSLAGGLIPILNWYAPPLMMSGATAAGGLGQWSEKDIADFLQTGISAKGVAFGPMAEVVRVSLQHLSDPDISAMAGYLKAVPGTSVAPATHQPQYNPQQKAMLKLGVTLYENHCMDCHQANGGGIPPAYPALAGNSGLTMPLPINAIRMVLNGGYPPSTEHNPRPYGMPPFGPMLEDEEVAALVSYIRNAWGNQASLVSGPEVRRYRAAPLD